MSDSFVAQSPASASPMIEVEHLTKVYGLVTAVDDVSFTVGAGEILGFLGPNGAGKTTTMRILTCYTPATSGRVRIGGYDTVRQSMEARSIMGYLPENAPLYIDMTVREYLSFMGEIKRLRGRALRAAIDEVIDECGLHEVHKRLIRNLSKGYRQRVGLAQALLGDPKVLVLDEPTVGLDPRQIREIRQLIKAMAGRRTVILSTHILPEVSMTCQKVVIINQGRVQAWGTPENLVSTLQGGNVIMATIEGAQPLVLERLARVEGVDRAEVDRPLGEHTAVYRVQTQEGRDPRAALAAAIVQAGFKLHELQSIGLSLEDVFLRIIATQQEEAA